MSSKMTLTRVCKNCEKTFQAHTTVTQCCGQVCARAYYKKKKRAEKMQGSDKETLVRINVSMEALKMQAFLSIRDTEQLLGISKSTVLRLLKSGRLPYAKFGRRTLIHRNHIDQQFNL